MGWLRDAMPLRDDVALQSERCMGLYASGRHVLHAAEATHRARKQAAPVSNGQRRSSGDCPSGRSCRIARTSFAPRALAGAAVAVGVHVISSVRPLQVCPELGRPQDAFREVKQSARVAESLPAVGAHSKDWRQAPPQTAVGAPDLVAVLVKFGLAILRSGSALLCPRRFCAILRSFVRLSARSTAGPDPRPTLHRPQPCSR